MPLLKRMEGLGLLERSRSCEDERKVLLSVTEEGRALKARALEWVARGVEYGVVDREGVGDLRDKLRAFMAVLGDAYP